ncbi:MAG TPA: aldose epimerase family protein [Longimicrobiales bacterium]
MIERMSDVVTLRNYMGAELEVIPRGAVIRALCVPDRNGDFADVVLGYDTPATYRDDRWYIGAVIGRYANRIRNGRFSLDGVDYQLACNAGAHHLHGGPRGFHTADWRSELVTGLKGEGVRLTHTSENGDEGYPGTLRVEVTYTLTDDNELVIDYRAQTDRPTIINLTQHSYFNLGGSNAADVLEHELLIAADQYLPIDAEGLPAGAPADVNGTPFDFRQRKRLRDGLQASDEQLRLGRGYDHCFVLRKTAGELAWAARLFEPQSGRTLEVLTTEPGMQLYTGQFLAPVAGKAGRPIDRFAGLCLETQHFPDSPNQAAYPPAVLRPGQDFVSTTIYRFGVKA